MDDADFGGSVTLYDDGRSSGVVDCDGEKKMAEMEKVFDELSIGVASPKEDTQVLLDERVWESLPEEIVTKVLAYLPVAAQCRFRCVSREWKALLTTSRTISSQHYSSEGLSRPPCTIMCGQNTSFFCHIENKWFNFPGGPARSGHLCRWDLWDVDGGLLCYQSRKFGDVLFCVCNPITQSDYVIETIPIKPLTTFQLVKLVVDRKTKSFKVILINYSRSPCRTQIFDSTTGRWNSFQSRPYQTCRNSFFVRKHVLYNFILHPDKLVGFNLLSWAWTEVGAPLPCKTEEGHCCAVTNKDRVMLVQINPVEGDSDREPICAWRLWESAYASDSDPANWKWEKVTIACPAPIKRIAGEFRSCIFHSNEYICFITETSEWVKYTFGTEAWRAMPYGGKSDASYGWFDWEPGVDAGVYNLDWEVQAARRIHRTTTI